MITVFDIVDYLGCDLYSKNMLMHDLYVQKLCEN